MRTPILTLALMAALGSSSAFAQVAPTAITVSPSDAMGSNLVGLDVRNAANEDVGEIEDVVLDRGMKVKGLVLSVGGFVGVGSKYVVVDPSAVAITYDANAKEWKAVMSATKDQLTAIPEFKYEGKFDD